MNNGKKYKELIEQIEKAKTGKEKINLLAVLLFLIATNDLDTIYKHIKRLWIGMTIILIAIFLSDLKLAESIINLISRFF